jgi:hypothetical protein
MGSGMGVGNAELRMQNAEFKMEKKGKDFKRD